MSAALRPRLAAHRHSIVAVASSVGTLVASFGTGILLARALGTVGRGETTALTTVPLLVTWVFALGSVPTISYFRSQDRIPAAQLLGTWLAILVPLGAVAVLAGELLVPVLFAAQTDATRSVAAATMPFVAVLLLNEVVLGFQLGDHRYTLYAVVRVASMALIALAFAVVEVVWGLTVVRAVVANLAVQTAVAAYLLWVSIARHGLARPSRAVARETLWFGFRGHAMQLGQMVNARFDLLIMPAFLAASSVGLYSVATNVSWIVCVLPATIAVFLVPRLAGVGGESRDRTVRTAAVTTGLLATAAAIPLAIAGPFVLETVYGDAFSGAAASLRILLPGSIALAVGQVYASALVALGRPGTAALTMVAGVLVTLVGLLLFLRDGGIEAAAWTSTVTYVLVLVVSVAAYRRARSRSASGLGAGDGDAVAPVPPVPAAAADPAPAVDPAPVAARGDGRG